MIVSCLALFMLRSTAVAQAVNEIDTVFGTVYNFKADGDTFISTEVEGVVSWFCNFSNTTDSTGAEARDLNISLTSDKEFYWFSQVPDIYSPPIYQWSFGNIPQHTIPNWTPQLSIGLNGGPPNTAAITIDHVAFTPPFDMSRSTNKNRFTTRDRQILTITLIPRETLNYNISVKLPKSDNVTGQIISTSAEAKDIYLNANRSILTIYSNQLEAGAVLTYTVTIKVIPNVPEVEFMPSVAIAASRDNAHGSTEGNMISQTIADVGTWTLNTEGSYNWTWGELLSMNVYLGGYALTLEAEPLQPSFTESVPLPNQLSREPEVISTNIGLAMATVLIFYLSATIFNSSIKENHEIIQRWLNGSLKRFRFLNISASRITGDKSGYKPKLRLYLEQLFVVLLCALIYWFLDPYFTNGLRGIALFISLAMGIALATLCYDGIQVLVSNRRFRVPAKIGIYPMAIPVAAVCVVLSRAIHFHPGIIYGFVGAYTAASVSRRLNDKQEAITILYSTVVILTVSIATFFLREPLYDLGWQGSNFLRYLVDDILVATNVVGLEGLVFSFIPLTFLDGAKLKKWNVWVWLIVACTITFAFYYIFINQDGSFVEATKNMKTIVMYAVMGISLVISTGVWLYFRMRYRHLPNK